jgi:hypothetical protein
MENIMKKSSVYLALSMLFMVGLTQAATFENKPITYELGPTYEGGEKIKIQFPFVVTEDSKVSKQINTFLHHQILETLPSNGEKMQTINNTNISEFSLTDMKVINNGRVIYFSFNTEGCGAYCETYDSQYEFDTRTGRVLTAQELIKPDAFGKIAKIMSKEHAKVIKDYIKKLEKEKKQVKGKNKKAELENIDDTISMFESCLSDWYDKDSHYDLYKKHPGVMTVLDGGVNFQHGRCSNHAMRALDELWDFNYPLKGDELKPYLTEYGKYIFFGEGSGEVPIINPYSQLYQGKIGKIDMVLYMGDTKKHLSKDIDNSFKYDGEKYYYTKYKNPIGLSVDIEALKKGEYVLTENPMNSDAKKEDQPKLQFRIVGNKLVGKWISKDKILPFEATPF